MLTVAYIGFGNSVCEYHLPYVDERKDFIKVKYIYRREEDRVGDIEREEWYPEINFTSDLDQVMQDENVNLIVVNTPNQFHTYYSKLALNNGKNVLCEKPFAETPQEAREVFELAKEKGLYAFSNQNRRYDADMRTLRKVIESDVLGDIVEVESHYDYFRPEHAQNYIGFEKISGVGVHPLDQIVSLFGVPKRVVYDCRSIANPGKADDYYDFDMFYNRFKAVVKTNYYVKLEYPRFIAHGTKGSFIMPQLGHNSDVIRKPGRIKLEKTEHPEDLWGTLSYINEKGEDITCKIPVEQNDYGQIYNNINDVIENGAEKIVKDEEIIAVLEIVENGIQAAKEAE
ncbi:oxidoreductase [Oceanobacillus oncorhynchi subsp. oncorhynchi]|uniref:Gfo/Idh/MocA family oxidoreductase n=1 Tax=Oceanobacillus oncorhynchi TaxID=545501 RepID=UPI0031DC4167